MPRPRRASFAAPLLARAALPCLLAAACTAAAAAAAPSPSPFVFMADAAQPAELAAAQAAAKKAAIAPDIVHDVSPTCARAQRMRLFAMHFCIFASACVASCLGVLATRRCDALARAAARADACACLRSVHMSVTYAGGVRVTGGERLTRVQAAGKPEVAFAGTDPNGAPAKRRCVDEGARFVACIIATTDAASHALSLRARAAALYTLMMVDPDAPDPNSPVRQSSCSRCLHLHAHPHRTILVCARLTRTPLRSALLRGRRSATGCTGWWWTSRASSRRRPGAR
jgi:hypothetical protein